MKFYLFVLALILTSCTTATLTNGKSTVTYRGAKIFSPTVLSLRDGNCAVPTVDAASVVQEPTMATSIAPPSAMPACTTTAMTVNGVDLKGLLNFVEMGILGGIAAG